MEITLQKTITLVDKILISEMLLVVPSPQYSCFRQTAMRSGLVAAVGYYRRPVGLCRLVCYCWETICRDPARTRSHAKSRHTMAFISDEFQLYPCQTERFGHSRNLPYRRLGISLRSKRFGRVFRTFETLLFFALTPIFARPKSKKMLRKCGKTYGNACYAGYLGIIEGAMITKREEVANISHDPDIELSRPKFAKFKIKSQLFTVNPKWRSF